MAHLRAVSALRTREDKREDAQVNSMRVLKGVIDRWHLYLVVS